MPGLVSFTSSRGLFVALQSGLGDDSGSIRAGRGSRENAGFCSGVEHRKMAIYHNLP